MNDVHVLGPLRAPEEIVRAIQEIDPKAELVHLEGKKWWLGVRAPNPAAVEQLEDAHRLASTRPTIPDPAERAMAEVELAREFQMYQVMARGFRPIAIYTVDGGLREDGWAWPDVVDDFRQRDRHYRTTSPDQRYTAIKRAISMDWLNLQRAIEWGKMATEAAAEAFRFVFKKAKSFTRRAIGSRRR
jgi:hypothetical protein